MTNRRPTVRLGQDARRRICDAALELFREHGVEATSLQMIADHLGVTKAAIYYHFKTKGEILLGAAGPVLAEAFAFLDEVEVVDDPAARIDAVVERVVDFMLQNRALLIPSSEGNVFEQANLDEPDAISAAWPRLVRLLAGPDARPERVVAAELYLMGAGAVVTGELRAGRDDEELREALLWSGRALLLSEQQGAGHSASHPMR